MARVSARFSKSLASRRLRPNQEKVRSTTQRRGRTTKPFMSSLRLTIARRSRGTFATAASTTRCSRHRPRSVRAKGSACVSCRGRARPRRGLGSRPSGRRRASAALHCRPGRGFCRPSPACRRTAPFSADLTDWLSRTTAEGLASRPIRSRSAMYSSAQIASWTPSRWTCERCCRRSSAAESCRGADSAKGSRCAANRRWRSSPRACRSCAVAHPASLGDQRCQPRPLRIPQIGRITVDFPPTDPTVLLRPHRRSPSW